MSVNLISFEVKYNISNNIFMGLRALKSANRILFLDMVGTFLIFKSVILRNRGPPNINLNFKNLN